MLKCTDTPPQLKDKYQTMRFYVHKFIAIYPRANVNFTLKCPNKHLNTVHDNKLSKLSLIVVTWGVRTRFKIILSGVFELV